VGSEVAVHDPSLASDEFTLDGGPLIGRCRFKAGSPEVLVQLYGGKPGDCAQAIRKG
jgi:hypothetical protein